MIGSWKSHVIGSKGGDWCISICVESEGHSKD